jgi:hypothetical protein
VYSSRRIMTDNTVVTADSILFFPLEAKDRG